jgi:hypothetical protein
MGKDSEVYEPGDPAYEELDKLASTGRTQRARLDYRDIAKAYNRASVGAILILGDARTRSGNVAKSLEVRGLERGVDFEVTRPEVDTRGHAIAKNDRRVMVRKCSDRPMKISQ